MFLKHSRHFLLFTILLFALCACKTLTIPYSNSTIPVDEALQWNEKVKENKCDIHLKDGRILLDVITRIRSNEIVYVENGDYKTLNYNFIKEIHIKPQINSSLYIGIGLLGLSSYLLVSELTSSDKTSGGLIIPVILTSGSGYFFYRGIELKTTILSFD